MLYAGIDLGTSSVKLILCDELGNVINSVTKEYDIIFPRDGWAEQEPDKWYEKTVEALCALVGNRGAELKGISFGGQMHGLVMLDEHDEVIRPAILWNDNRSVAECDYLNCVIGKEKLTCLTANIAFPGFTAPKILWVKNNEPENFDRCKKIMLPKDYLVYKLSGMFVTEPSDASGMLLFDVKNKCWSSEMLDLCGISEDMLPKVCNSFEAVGKLKGSVADKVGAKDVVIAPGAGDNAAAAVGMGVSGNGKCSISVGTSGTVFIALDSFKADKNNALHTFAHADGGYHLMGCVLSAASCNKWWVQDILKTEDYDKEQQNITNLGENKVMFLPYLMGERSPHNDPYARGAFVGMSMASTRCEMTQAVLEGVAYALRDCVEAARGNGVLLSEAYLCGGGAKSALWKRILANVLRMKLIEPVCTEGPSYGGAILAMVASGEYSSVNEAAENIVKVKNEINFDEETAAKYDEGYEKYKELYTSLKKWYNTLNIKLR